MKRIVLAAVIVSLVSVGAYPATKAKTKTAKATTAAAPKVPLTALFPAPAAQTVSAGGMITMDAPNHEVVMVRINEDSSRSHACVNTEAAARAFLDSPKNATPPVKQEH